MCTFEIKDEAATKLMPKHSEAVDSVKTKILGQIGLKPDLKAWFHNYPYAVDFFELISAQKRKIIIGFMLSDEASTEANIILIHTSVKNLRKDLVGDRIINHDNAITKEEQSEGAKIIKPEIIITFRLKANGILQALVGGEGSRRINIGKFDPSFEDVVFDLIKQMNITVRGYNLSRTKEIRKEMRNK